MQIDESVMVRAKYHRGRHRWQRWVFGVYDLVLHQGYIQMVQSRDARMLLRITSTSSLPEQRGGPMSGVHMPNW